MANYLTINCRDAETFHIDDFYGFKRVIIELDCLATVTQLSDGKDSASIGLCNP